MHVHQNVYMCDRDDRRKLRLKISAKDSLFNTPLHSGSVGPITNYLWEGTMRTSGRAFSALRSRNPPAGRSGGPCARLSFSASRKNMATGGLSAELVPGHYALENQLNLRFSDILHRAPNRNRFKFADVRES